ncbi:MAG TPA: undecaprenyl-diphosphate phosphatase [Burkholderiales bacterium]|nr:undecaprenyl-diphosphate phosphatase [Pseudomonadota bacterium]HVC49581.1 undecaprenyl-diphosphate phosphatase [Burkholderiales bacterium]
MTTLHLYLIAIMQGVTELFPISSLGHSVLVPAIFKWSIDRTAPWFLPFVVILHLGTASAMLLYFWKDWYQLIGSAIKTRGNLKDPSTALLAMLAVGSIPAGLLGLFFEHPLSRLFGGYVIVAICLILNGIMLIMGDRLKKSILSGRTMDRLGFGDAILVGCAQALALIPGMSRSGATLVAGLFIGLDYEASARFSFLLATPIISAAGLLEVPKLFHHLTPGVPLGTIILAGLLAGLFSWMSTWFLMRYFKKHEAAALRPFGFYCLIAGIVALALHFS